MAQNVPPYASDPGRVDSVRVARRQLLTSRTTSEQTPPRVVLHLPDLNALDGVVLGPPKPITHRRTDAAHTAAPTYSSSSRENHADARDTRTDVPTRTQPTLANVFRVPLDKLMPSLGNGTPLEKIGKLIVLVQQPKMLMAAVAAAALQLAAVLAMFTGNASTDNAAKSTTPDTKVAATSEPPFAGFAPTRGSNRPIRTPASTGFAPAASSAAPTSVAGPSLAPTLAPSLTPTLAPTLPSPQSLPGAISGASPGDLPWQAPAEMAAAGAPTLAPPKPANKPTRAKLVGTIKSLGTSGATP